MSITKKLEVLASLERLTTEMKRAATKKESSVKEIFDHSLSKLICNNLNKSPAFDIRYEFSQSLSYVAVALDRDNNVSDSPCNQKFEVRRVQAMKSSDEDILSIDDIDYRIVLHESRHITTLTSCSCQYPDSTGKPCRHMLRVATQLNWTKALPANVIDKHWLRKESSIDKLLVLKPKQRDLLSITQLKSLARRKFESLVNKIDSDRICNNVIKYIENKLKEVQKDATVEKGSEARNVVDESTKASKTKVNTVVVSGREVLPPLPQKKKGSQKRLQPSRTGAPGTKACSKAAFEHKQKVAKKQKEEMNKVISL